MKIFSLIDSGKYYQTKNRLQWKRLIDCQSNNNRYSKINNYKSNYFFVESALIFVESVVAAAEESVVAGVVTVVSAGAVTVVESEVASVFVELPLQADNKAAAAKTTNNFFIFV